MFIKEMASKILKVFADANGKVEEFFKNIDLAALEAGGFEVRGKTSEERMQHLVRQASLGNMQPIKIGSVVLGDITDVTDPCYDRGGGNDLHIKTVPGMYEVYIQYSDASFDGEWDFRIATIRVVHSMYQGERGLFWPEIKEAQYYVGTAPVDAGLCGFYNRKPDFDAAGWHEFCDGLGNWSEWKFSTYDGRNGVCCSSGFGDGCYAVYGYARVKSEGYSIVEIAFISDK